MNFFSVPARTIEGLRPNELEPLVDARAHAEILSLAQRFPIPAQTVCYECRLSQSDGRVDFAVALFPFLDERVMQGLSGLREQLSGHTGWSRCIEFLQNWGAGNFQPSFPFVCVAFDLEQQDAALPVPCLSVCVDPEFFTRRLGWAPRGTLDAARLVTLTQTCFSQLHGEALPPSSLSRLARCLSAADDVEPKHISFMLSRSPVTAKIDLRLRVAAIQGFLQRLGFPQSASGIRGRIQELMPEAREVQLNVAFHPELLPVLEVEFMTGAHNVSRDGRFAFLDRLVDFGLCSPPKARVLRETWLNPVTREADGFALARSWYVKVRFQGDRAMDAKAYLGLMPRLGGRA